MCINCDTIERVVMKEFSEVLKCDKCGSQDISRSYHTPERLYVKCSYSSSLYGLPIEHHFMHCRGCGFAWQEEVKG